jgi:3-hydroxybutyryl-CoA dehydrogenase
MAIQKILVVGSGFMGSGITQVGAQAGYDMIMVDVQKSFAEKGLATIKGLLQKQVEKGKISQADMDSALSRIQIGDDIGLGKDADLVIEAIPEKLPLKQEMFRQLDQVINPEAVLATNTSSLSVTAIASVTKRPERVVGMHFFSPVPVMKLVEIIRALTTSPETVQAVREVAEKMGKEPVDAADYSGFIVNRILCPMMNEAAYLVMEGMRPEDVDKAMRLGANHPIGPLGLADLVGIDVLLHTMESLYDGFSDSKYRPCPLLKRMVEAGQLGRKTKKGFYTYD